MSPSQAPSKSMPMVAWGGTGGGRKGHSRACELKAAGTTKQVPSLMATGGICCHTAPPRRVTGPFPQTAASEFSP